MQKIKIREAYHNVSTILDFAPGESAQVDFGMGPMMTDVHTGEIFKTWIFVMVLSWSRHQYAEIITNQKVETWLGCHKCAFEFFGGVPKRIIIDNAKCAITKACYYDLNVQRSYAECAQSYGFIISACPPYDPKKKGRVEAGVKYVKKNFMPLRDFRSAQGICALEKKYCKNRLNAACKRALAFDAVNYKSIKNILEAGVEYNTLPSEEAFDLLADAYTGKGKYYRNTKLIIQ